MNQQGTITLNFAHLEDIKASLQRLTPEHPLKLPANIHFYLAGLKITVHIRASERFQTSLRLSARIGHVPFTYEDAEARRNVFAWLKQAAPKFPGDIRLDSQGSLWLDQVTGLDFTPNAIQFLSITAQLLVALFPYLSEIMEHLIPIAPQAQLSLQQAS